MKITFLTLLHSYFGRITVKTIICISLIKLNLKKMLTKTFGGDSKKPHNSPNQYFTPQISRWVAATDFHFFSFENH